MDTQAFEIFAEISIAVLGFSGITAAIGGRNDKKSFLIFRIKGLLFTSGIASMSSIAPLTGLDLFYCALGNVALVTVFQIWSIAGFLRNKSAQASRIIFPIASIIAISSIGALLYSLYLAPETLHYTYLYAISVTLLLAGIFFVRFVLAITAIEEEI